MTTEFAPKVSRRSDRAVAAAVFGVGAALVGYALGGTAFPTDSCRSTSITCDDFNTTRAWLGIVAAGVAVLVAFGLREVVRPLRQRRTMRRTGTAEAPGWPQPVTRMLLYVVTLIAATIFAFGLGTGHFESTYCNENDPDYGGECDLAPVEGVIWAVGGVVLVFSGVTANEVQLLRRRRRR